MITIDNLLFGFTAGLIGLKVAVLAMAALLFASGLYARARQHKLARTQAPARRRRLDVRV